MKPMIVLSLFDGMSCGQIALRELGVPILRYYASEFDRFAIAQTQLNFPDTIQLGDVKNVNVFEICKHGVVDMLIGGSPCQSFSFAGKRVGMKTTENQEIYTLNQYLQLKHDGFEFEGQSYLFWEYMRILTDLRKINPNILFLLENVEMGKKWERVLSEAIGIRGVHINSALVSAQNRRRIYWSNIRVRREGLFGDAYTDIPQPSDRGISLKDILQDKVDEKYFLSDKVVERIIGRDRFSDDKFKFGMDKSSPVLSAGGGNNSDIDLICVSHNNETQDPVCLNKQRNEYGKQIRKAYDNHEIKAKRKEIRDFMPRNDGKTGVVTTFQMDNLLCVANEHIQKNLTDVEGKANSFLATSGKGAWANGMTLVEKDYRIRRITPTECARLQTIPEWYRWECSETQQYRMLGNGWTIEVIKHIFSFMDSESNNLK